MYYHMVMARKQVLVQLDDDLVAELDDVAARLGVSRSELLRRGARAVLQADYWATADEELVEGYLRIPEDRSFVETAHRLSVEAATEW